VVYSGEKFNGRFPVKYGFFSDAHGDFNAVESSLMALHDAEEIIFLGDCAGERDSEKCIRYLREHGITSVSGNHDRWIFEIKSLSCDNLEYLEKLPLSLEREGFLVLHSKYEEKGGEYFFQYVISSRECESVFLHYHHRLVFMGHTHIACVNELRNDKVLYTSVKSDSIITLDKDSRYIINVGMARNCVAVYDSKEDLLQFRFHHRDTSVETAGKSNFIQRLFRFLTRRREN